jgi:CDP-2,3-bis-(O-geranylgeranyl)-sn-glycerol synthase
MDGLAYRVLQLIYFMLPAYAANMAPPFTKYWKGSNPPIARRWLGAHKTVLGFASGVGAAVVVTFVQSRIGWSGSMARYESWLELGLGFGVGAMSGDSLKSFFKRRVGIAPGHPWIPFDQLDFVAGALLLTWSRAPLSLLDFGLVLAVSLVGDIVVNHLGYSLGIRDTPW